MNPEIKCPLCNGQKFVSSWLGAIKFNKKDFVYYECQSCYSFICEPMPDEETLLQMYGNAYFEDECPEEDISIEKFDEVIDFLKKRRKGVFVDYGCGDGSLLMAANKVGWKVIGVEFSPEVIDDLSRKSSFEIISHTSKPSELADVIHLGDVLEHLTDLNAQMPKIMGMLKEGGILIAHGPLEANPNLFNLMLKMSRKLKNTSITSIPPYHVILATTKGQQKLFERFGLSEILFRVTEIAFPAPYRLTLKDLMKPRQTALFITRKLSQAISSLSGVQNQGNRYFYIGEKL